MPIQKALLFFSFGFIVHYVAPAQAPIRYQADVRAGGASGPTPFWLRANQYGVVPLRMPNGQVRAGVFRDYRSFTTSTPNPTTSESTSTDSTTSDSTTFRAAGRGWRRPKADWGAGIEVVGNAGPTTQLLLPEAYVKARWGAFEFYAGRRRELFGLVDTLLSTGAYAWSGNALPIPKVQLGIPNFTAVPFTKGVIWIMGGYAHGWFDNNRFVQGSFLHQKFFYGRLGKPTWRVRLTGGVNHQVIWAGRSDSLSPLVAINGRLPSSWRYYRDVVIGRRGNQTDTNITSFEWNRVGNHLGSVDVAIDITLRNWDVGLYRQFLYDDGSLFYLTNLADGLNGLRLKNRRPPSGAVWHTRQVLVELLYTLSQGGNQFEVLVNNLRGRDDYFNHAQFIDGWTYRRQTIGTPFIMPDRELRPELPNRRGIANNRVAVWHVGLNGLLLNKIDVTTRLSYSRNYGTYNVPFPTVPRQFSGMVMAAAPVNWLGGFRLTGTLAVDVGGLLPNSVGAQVGVQKMGFLSQ